MRYHCIGEHGSKLAGLHGPAWLDTAEIDRIIGRLYPLYREPKVHSAPTALERRP